MAAAGIRNSRQLFDLAKNNQENLSADLELARETLTELVGLSDLVRAYGVGPAFARILYDTGIHSIGEFRSYTPRQVIDLYEKEAGKKADFSAGDIKFSLDLVQMLDIEYAVRAVQGQDTVEEDDLPDAKGKQFRADDYLEDEEN